MFIYKWWLSLRIVFVLIKFYYQNFSLYSMCPGKCATSKLLYWKPETLNPTHTHKQDIQMRQFNCFIENLKPVNGCFFRLGNLYRIYCLTRTFDAVKLCITLHRRFFRDLTVFVETCTVWYYCFKILNVEWNWHLLK